MKRLTACDGNTMSGETKMVETLKADLLEELHLMKPADLRAYWRQAKWPKPSLVDLSKSELAALPRSMGSEKKRACIFAPIRYALTKLQPKDVATASPQLDPFGSLLEAVDIGEWSEFCRVKHAPWMSRVWLAAASQLRAEQRLIFKAHGWSDTWEKLRRKPENLRAAEDFFSAQLNHARGQRRTELLAIRVNGLSETSGRRLRRARIGKGKRMGVSLAEMFLVQHWLELPHGFPGLCFFSDVALNSLFDIFGLSAAKCEATKQMRVRLGLFQAGAKRHFIDDVISIDGELRFISGMLRKPYRFNKGTVITWGERRLWPR